jgi:hypothetical protein
MSLLLFLLFATKSSKRETDQLSREQLIASIVVSSTFYLQIAIFPFIIEMENLCGKIFRRECFLLQKE